MLYLKFWFQKWELRNQHLCNSKRFAYLDTIKKLRYSMLLYIQMLVNIMMENRHPVLSYECLHVINT